MKKIILLCFMFVICYAQGNFESDFKKGKEYFENENFEKARDVFEILIEKNEKSAKVNFYLGYSLFKNNELDDAIEYLEIAVELEPYNVEYNFKLAQLYGIDARDASIFRVISVASSMKEQLLKTLELDPNHLEARIYLANFYLQAPGIAGGDLEQAKIEAEKIIKFDEMRGRILLSQIYLEEDELEKAENEFKIVEQKFADNPDSFSMYNSYGYFLLNQNRIDEAIVKFEKQVQFAPENANAHDSLGEAYKINREYEKSIAEYKKALALNPGLKSATNAIEELNLKIIKK